MFLVLVCFTAMLMLLLTRECAMNELSQCGAISFPEVAFLFGEMSLARSTDHSLGCKLYINLIGI